MRRAAAQRHAQDQRTGGDDRPESRRAVAEVGATARRRCTRRPVARGQDARYALRVEHLLACHALDDDVAPERGTRRRSSTWTALTMAATAALHVGRAAPPEAGRRRRHRPTGRPSTRRGRRPDRVDVPVERERAAAAACRAGRRRRWHAPRPPRPAPPRGRVPLNPAASNSLHAPSPPRTAAASSASVGLVLGIRISSAASSTISSARALDRGGHRLGAVAGPSASRSGAGVELSRQAVASEDVQRPSLAA